MSAHKKLHLPGIPAGSLSFSASGTPEQESHAERTIDALEELAAIVEDFREKRDLPRRVIAMLLMSSAQFQIMHDLRDDVPPDEAAEEEVG